MAFEGRASTHKDCEKCDFSIIVDVPTDYECKKYVCRDGFIIQGLNNNRKKPCGLSNGKYYKQTRYVANDYK